VFKSRKYFKTSFSQDGEDVVLFSLAKFRSVKSGFYVDVGAHHPQRFSNTNLFYNIGWRGINIDATPGSMKLFKKLRPQDQNIECAISSSESKIEFCIHKEPALNGIKSNLDNFKPPINKDWGSKLDNKSYESIFLETYTLENILSKYITHLPVNNFLTIDAEGHDLEILKSNNWTKFKFEWIIAELGSFEITKPNENNIIRYLSEVGYDLKGATKRSGIFGVRKRYQ
jgi:hypothetical protein